MLRMLPRTLLVAYVLSGTLMAQERSDFSGTWVMDVSWSEAVTLPYGPERPVIQVITQTPNVITVQRHVDGRPESVRYFFGSSEPQPVGTNGSQTEPLSGRASWREHLLETTVPLTINGWLVTRTERRSLDVSGTRMTVETVLVVQHGYGGSSGAPPNNVGVMRDVYIKHTPGGN